MLGSEEAGEKFRKGIVDEIKKESLENIQREEKDEPKRNQNGCYSPCKEVEFPRYLEGDWINYDGGVGIVLKNLDNKYSILRLHSLEIETVSVEFMVGSEKLYVDTKKKMRILEGINTFIYVRDELTALMAG